MIVMTVTIALAIPETTYLNMSTQATQAVHWIDHLQSLFISPRLLRLVALLQQCVLPCSDCLAHLSSGRSSFSLSLVLCVWCVCVCVSLFLSLKMPLFSASLHVKILDRFFATGTENLTRKPYPCAKTYFSRTPPPENKSIWANMQV